MVIINFNNSDANRIDEDTIGGLKYHRDTFAITPVLIQSSKVKDRFIRMIHTVKFVTFATTGKIGETYNVGS